VDLFGRRTPDLESDLMPALNFVARPADTSRMDDLNEDRLEALLEQLEAEERHVSATRRRLHDRIAMSPGGSSRADLERRERELSTERRELHRRIDELRSRRNVLRSEHAG
jgi:hypothetical protein